MLQIDGKAVCVFCEAALERRLRRKWRPWVNRLCAAQCVRVCAWKCPGCIKVLCVLPSVHTERGSRLCQRRVQSLPRPPSPPTSAQPGHLIPLFTPRPCDRAVNCLHEYSGAVISCEQTGARSFNLISFTVSTDSRLV